MLLRPVNNTRIAWAAIGVVVLASVVVALVITFAGGDSTPTPGGLTLEPLTYSAG